MQLSKITYNFLEQADFLKLLCSTFLSAFSSLLKKVVDTRRKYLLDKVSYDSGVNINPSLYLFKREHSSASASCTSAGKKKKKKKNKKKKMT